jgi:uncharacterized hydrophobic protein (TIGR00271 family)
VALFFFSAVVATLGLITNNVAVVVGAMIIAPAFGPIASAAIGIVAGRMDIFRDAVRTEAIGIGIALLTAAFLGFILPGVEMNESLRLRMYPTIFDLLVGLAAGAAGGYVLVSGKSSSVVGVMVAAALVPVMAAIGIGMVFLNPLLVFGAFLLLIVTAVSISLSMVVVFWFAGPKQEHACITPKEAKKGDVGGIIERARMNYDYKLRKLVVKRMIKYSVILIIVLTIPLVWLTYEDIITKTPEREITTIFEQNANEKFELGDVVIEGNNVLVAIYVYDPLIKGQLQDIYIRVRDRVDRRYKIVFSLIDAEKSVF